jgi:hypothetical protein
MRQSSNARLAILAGVASTTLSVHAAAPKAPVRKAERLSSETFLQELRAAQGQLPDQGQEGAERAKATKPQLTAWPWPIGFFS